MNILPFALIFGFVFWGGVFVVFIPKAHAVTIAEQTQNYGNQLNVWQAIQELGTNLSGAAQSFTFRVSTARSNLNQFDFTAQNTRIYDKDAANAIVSRGCASGNSSNPLRGLTFNTIGIPVGYQDVAIDFSCNNYSFIPGHRYLILITNANMGNEGSGKILFAAAAYGQGGEQSTDRFEAGGLRYGNGNQWDFSNNSGSCDVSKYIYGSQTYVSGGGCFIWTTPKDDLYFVLTNNAPPPPPPKTPVIFIPGIGGSELKATQDIIWSALDGHGGNFSHAYANNEKIWVNQDEAAKLGEDDYFDVLRLKTDGVTSEADLSLTGSLTSFGYGDIDSFFQGLGYEKGKNFFVFPYDWRKDVRETRDSLDALVEEAKTKSGQTKVNIVAHSIGGLVARYYISDSGKAAKVNKLIGLGVPHLGSVKAIKTIMYGDQVGPSYLFGLIALNINEVKDVAQNLTSMFQLKPNKIYYDFYQNLDSEHPYPFFDNRDIDNNKITGVLNYDQIKTLFGNLGHNIGLYSLAEQLHDQINPLSEKINGVKLYNLVGSNQPTLGQIRETWLTQWPINLVAIRDQIFINGDGTVPLYSASLKSSTKDLSAGASIYYIEQEHSDLVRSTGPAMQSVKAILAEDSLPVEVKSEKIDLEGQQISLDDGELELFDDLGNHTGIKDDGEIETNISETFYSTSGKTKHAFVKKKAKKVKVRTTRKKKTAKDPKTTNIKVRHYKKDKVSKTTIYRDLSIPEIAKVEFDLDPTVETSPTLTLFPDSTKTENTNITLTSEVSGGSALDQTSPTTTIDKSGTNPVTITLTGSDSDSGILKIEYSLDNGQTVQTYTNPFTISTSGKTTLQVKSIDKLGNEEIPQEVVIEIASSSSSSASSSSSSGSSSTTSSQSNSSTSEEPVSVTSEVLRSDSSEVEGSVLGISFQNPAPSAQLTTDSELPITNSKLNPILSGLLMISGGIAALASLGLITTFLKPPPK